MKPPSGSEGRSAGARTMAAGLTSYEIELLVVVVFLVVIGIGFGLYARARLQRRKAQLLGELRNRPDLVQDRAFNRIAMARREAELLAGQGVDVGRARDQIAEAQAAFDNRRYEQAYQTAQVAHESLVNARRTGPRLSSAPPRSGSSGNSPPSPPASPVGAPAPSAAAAPAPAPPVAKNRAESQFQLRLLDQELASARSNHSGAPVTIDAGELATRAHSAFDRSDFTEAFRLALKGRRALGGSIESLPPTPGGPVPTDDPGPRGFDGNLGARSDATETAEKVAGAERCSECGYPALPGDAFCRGCGRPRSPSACAKCGTPRTPSDTFCGRCGAAFA